MKKTNEQFKNDVKNLVGDGYSVISEYQGSRSLVKFRHNECGHEYETKAYVFTNNGSRCPKRNGGHKKTHNEFVEEVKQLGMNNYEVIGTYKNAYTKVSIKHNECGYEWSIYPSSFLQGSRCPKCSAKEISERFRNNPKDFSSKFYKASNEYELLSDYVDSNTKVKVKHRKCGETYDIFPHNFLKGNRCNKCVSKKESEKRAKKSV